MSNGLGTSMSAVSRPAPAGHHVPSAVTPQNPWAAPPAGASCGHPPQWADWLFMIGLLGIGLALVLGFTMRIAASAGVAMLVLMWSAVLPPANNPLT